MQADLIVFCRGVRQRTELLWELFITRESDSQKLRKWPTENKDIEMGVEGDIDILHFRAPLLSLPALLPALVR